MSPVDTRVSEVKTNMIQADAEGISFSIVVPRIWIFSNYSYNSYDDE